MTQIHDAVCERTKSDVVVNLPVCEHSPSWVEQGGMFDI